MCLRFMFLLITRLAAWLRLARHEETWKTAEILILRHQLAVLQRQQPRRLTLNWADRAVVGQFEPPFSRPSRCVNGRQSSQSSRLRYTTRLCPTTTTRTLRSASSTA